MAKVSFTSWANTTEQTVCSTACRVTRIDCYPHDTQSAEVYVCFWDASNPTPGSTDTKMVIPIGTLTIQGRRKTTVVFPNGGIRFATACTIHCATSPENGTAPLTTALPPKIDVFYTTGN